MKLVALDRDGEDLDLRSDRGAVLVDEAVDVDLDRIGGGNALHCVFPPVL